MLSLKRLGQRILGKESLTIKLKSLESLRKRIVVKIEEAWTKNTWGRVPSNQIREK